MPEYKEYNRDMENKEKQGRRMSSSDLGNVIVRSREFASGEDEVGETRITDQLKFMAEQWEELSSLLHALEDRISPILLPAQASPSDLGSPSKENSDVVRLIDEHNGRLSELQRRIRGLLQRVQL